MYGLKSFICPTCGVKIMSTEALNKGLSSDPNSTTNQTSLTDRLQALKLASADLDSMPSTNRLAQLPVVGNTGGVQGYCEIIDPDITRVTVRSTSPFTMINRNITVQGFGDQIYTSNRNRWSLPVISAEDSFALPGAANTVGITGSVRHGTGGRSEIIPQTIQCVDQRQR